jgi:hypothetical protein
LEALANRVRYSPDEMMAKKADFSLGAEELSQEFARDEKAAGKKFGDKIVEVSGEVTLAHADVDGVRAFIMLSQGEGNRDFRCDMLERAPWAFVSQTTQVKVKGVMDSLGYVITDAVFSDRGTDAAISVTPDELIEAFIADNEAAEARFAAGKQVRLIGEVVDVQDGKAILKVNGPTKFICGFWTDVPGIVNSVVKPGATIGILGSVQNGSAEKVYLFACLPYVVPAQ